MMRFLMTKVISTLDCTFTFSCYELHSRNMFWYGTILVTSQLVLKLICVSMSSKAKMSSLSIWRCSTRWFHYSIVLEWVHSQSTVGLLFVLPSFSASQAEPKVMDSMTVQFPFYPTTIQPLLVKKQSSSLTIQQPSSNFLHFLPFSSIDGKWAWVCFHGFFPPFLQKNLQSQATRKTPCIIETSPALMSEIVWNVLEISHWIGDEIEKVDWKL